MQRTTVQVPYTAREAEIVYQLLLKRFKFTIVRKMYMCINHEARSFLNRLIQTTFRYNSKYRYPL
jgi:hypothetical protein